LKLAVFTLDEAAIRNLIQEQKNKMENQTMNQGGDFLKNHSAHYLEMAYSNDRRERIEEPDGYGKRTGECGDTIETFIMVRNHEIKTVSFDTDGCLNTNACANTVSILAEGKTIEQGWKITTKDVIDYLGTLPSEKIHCAELAIGSFYLALSDFQRLQRNPWKKKYKRSWEKKYKRY